MGYKATHPNDFQHECQDLSPSKGGTDGIYQHVNGIGVRSITLRNQMRFKIYGDMLTAPAAKRIVINDLGAILYHVASIAVHLKVPLSEVMEGIINELTSIRDATAPD